MNGESFAVKSGLVTEIVNDLQIYPLPFVPNYVCGLINQQGNPFVVVDPMLMMKKTAQNSNMLIIINDSTENLCVKISDILDFFDIKEENLVETGTDTTDLYFSAKLDWNGKLVDVLDYAKLLEKLKNDFCMEEKKL
ncbi:MAG: chemotaxis protein CheW [Treponemataceae bacterium]|nr:chemotaxis protein CheW [Treponemataceae bacterium]